MALNHANGKMKGMESSDFSSDEEDDNESLIPQNDTKPATSFHIDEENRDFQSPIRRRHNFNLNFSFNKRYLFAVFIPVVVLLVFFSSDIRNLLSSNLSPCSSGNLDSLSGRMRESELHALYLLGQQKLNLISLYNRSFVPVLNSSSNSSTNSSSALGTQNDHSLLSSSTFFEDVKSALLKQISLNKEIQQVLLAPHRSGNLSNEVESDMGFGDFSPDRCRKVDQHLSQRRTMEWKPRSDKFLFAVCVSGQMSNHLICLEKHMFFAALLNRILVIPSSKVDYQYSRVLDIVHINNCVGRKVVISFEEFAEIKKNHLQIDRLICYFSKPDPCFLDDDHIKKLKSLGVSTGKLEPPWVEDIKKPTKRTADEVRSKFLSNDDVIAIGDVFFADLEQEWMMQPGGPLAHQCKTLIEPSRLIMLTAQRFIQTFLGKDFVALHFRRHGFLKFCNAKQPSCFFPIPQAGACITRVVERANSPVIYLSTDAAESETGLLQSFLVVDGKPIPLVKRPPRNSAEKWDALLYRHGIEDDSQVDAMLDKTICAMSSVFIGAPGSTFTEDILRLRKDWGSASLCDEYLCQGEEPNFIAENE